MRSRRFSLRLDLLAVVVFVLFLLAVLVAPAVTLVFGSLVSEGVPSLDVYFKLFQKWGYRQAVATSFLLATTTAVVGTILGAVLAWVLYRNVSERFRSTMLSMATVATNYGGLPLVFGIVLLLGSQGSVTQILRLVFGSRFSFQLVSFWGLVIIYLNFLIPLCILTFMPSLEALHAELREAAEVHGARPYHFWRFVGGPILFPPLSASFVLIFVNAFGSYTTPWALIGGGSSLTLVTLQIGFLFGEAGYDPRAADGLAVVIILVAAVCILAYHLSMRRIARWSR